MGYENSNQVTVALRQVRQTPLIQFAHIVQTLIYYIYHKTWVFHWHTLEGMIWKVNCQKKLRTNGSPVEFHIKFPWFCSYFGILDRICFLFCECVCVFMFTVSHISHERDVLKGKKKLGRSRQLFLPLTAKYQFMSQFAL